MVQKRYEARFKAAHEADHSGPARSYWDIHTVSGGKVVTLCLHPETGAAPYPIATADAVATALDLAFEQGRADKGREIQRALGIKA
jgi:hypothetical protein